MNLNSANVQTTTNVTHQISSNSSNETSSAFIPVQVSLVNNGNALNQASTQSITSLLTSNKANTINKTILQPSNVSTASEPSTPAASTHVLVATPINNSSSTVLTSNTPVSSVLQSPANSLNAASNFGGFANCMNCGEYGVKAAFYGKAKLYCSMACQNGTKKQQSNVGGVKRPIDSINSPLTPQSSSSIIITPLSTQSIPIQPSTDTASQVKEQQTQPPKEAVIAMTPSPEQVNQPAPKRARQGSISTTVAETGEREPQQVKQADPPQQQTLHIQISESPSTVLNKSMSLKSPGAHLKSPVGFSWPHLIEKEKAVAAPVHFFKHAQLSDIWSRLDGDVVVEVPCRDPAPFVDDQSMITNTSPSKGKHVYWFARVVKFAGYFMKLRYLGFDDLPAESNNSMTSNSQDFWMHLNHPNVHYVSWSAENGVSLAPPNCLMHTKTDWHDYLLDTLVNYKTLPNNFKRTLKESMSSRFKIGMTFELVDKKRISQMRVARVIENVGGRLRVKYEHTDDFDDFWCHQNSDLIHPIGWCMQVGHEIAASDEYKKKSLTKLKTNNYLPDEASPDLFIKPRNYKTKSWLKFKVNMKLEAVDPLNLSAICVATVRKVLNQNYLMVQIDSNSSNDEAEKEDEPNDMFCYHRFSSSIFPAGFCQKHQIDLQAPYNYEGPFDWPKYLRETKSQFAPIDLFPVELSTGLNPFKVGMKLECVDLMDPKLICVATVKQVVNRLIKVGFDGWDSEYDQWLDFESCDIFPVGWCQLVNYPLEVPLKANSSESEKKSKRSKKKR